MDTVNQPIDLGPSSHICSNSDYSKEDTSMAANFKADIFKAKITSLIMDGNNGEPEDNIIEYIESPIKAPIARRILETKLYNSQVPDTRILEFRRKKVVKAELKKFYQLFQQQSYGSMQDLMPMSMPVIEPPVQKSHESDLVKKIRKSAIVRRLNNFWVHKTIHYPTVFKKRFLVKKSAGCERYLIEMYDLTKHQFDSKHCDKFEEVDN